MPCSDRDPADPCYGIKSTAEKYERVIPESRLTPLANVFS